MRMSDVIEEFIKELFDDGEEAIEIQRNELAEHFNCVPSQINYVISTRFKPSQGYYVESRRGGGGHISKEAKLLKVATSDNVLKLSKDIKDEVRARIFKNMLLNL